MINSEIEKGIPEVELSLLRRYESVNRFMRFLRSVDIRFGCPSFFNQSHLPGRPGGCHDLLLIAIGGMVADPILVAV
jgi:hypothetical protein